MPLSKLIEIILGIVGFVLLIILAVGIWGLMTKKNDIEQAKSTLEQIFLTIENLQGGNSSTYLVMAPKGWYLVYYNSGVNGGVEDSLPSKCRNDSGNFNCLCICPAYGSDLVTEDPRSVQKHVGDYLGYVGLEDKFKWAVEKLTGRKDHFYEFFHGSAGFDACDKEGVCRAIDKNMKIVNLRVEESDRDKVKWIDLMRIPRQLDIKLEGVGSAESVVINSPAPVKK